MDTLAKVTIRCLGLGMALLMLWFFLYATADDWMYDIHSEWFELSKQEFAMMHYRGMMSLKVLCFLFFLFPYIACKWCGKE